MTHRELSEGLNDLIFNLSLEYEREQMNQDKNNPNYIENYIKENPLSETDFEILSEKLYGTSGYRGTELSILIKDEQGNIKFEDIEREEYYPIWQLYNQNITPNIIRLS